MEVMEMKENETVAAVSETAFTNAMAVDLINVLDRIMGTTENLPVKVSYALQKNIDKLSVIVTRLQKASTDIVSTYVEKDEKGAYKLTSLTEEDAKDPQKVAAFRPEYIYKSEEAKIECNKVLNDKMNEECVIAFHTIPLSYIQDVKIDTRKFIKSFTLFTTHIITEEC